MVSYRRNIAVGIVMSTAMVLLAWMLLKFGARPAAFFAPRTLPVTILADRVDGLGVGSAIQFRGVNAGSVRSIGISDDNTHVIIQGDIIEKSHIPANVVPAIEVVSPLGGSAAIQLQLEGPPSGTLAAGTTLRATYVGYGALLPQEFTALATQLRKLTEDMRNANVVGNVNETVLSIKAQFEKAGKVMESLQAYVDDPKLREDIKAAVAQLRTASETASRLTANVDAFVANDLPKMSGQAQDLLASGKTTIDDARVRFDDLSDKIGARLGQLEKVFADFGAISEKINRGEGTAGKLINDPRLYTSLVETMESLEAAVKDLNRLIEQWEEEGIHLKLK